MVSETANAASEWDEGQETVAERCVFCRARAEYRATTLSGMVILVCGGCVEAELVMAGGANPPSVATRRPD